MDYAFIPFCLSEVLRVLQCLKWHQIYCVTLTRPWNNSQKPQFFKRRILKSVCPYILYLRQSPHTLNIMLNELISYMYISYLFYPGALVYIPYKCLIINAESIFQNKPFMQMAGAITCNPILKQANSVFNK